MLAKFSGVESERTASEFRIIIKKNKKRRKFYVAVVHRRVRNVYKTGAYIWASYTRRVRIFLCVLGMCEKCSSVVYLGGADE